MKTAESSQKATPARSNAPFFGKEAAQDFFVPGASGPVIQNKADASTPTSASTPAPVPTPTPAPKASLESRLSTNQGRGESLPEDTMEEMESSLGADLSKVRIHQDESAVQMSNELSAQAFTHGSDIYFNQGKYDTGSRDGQHLLAHELTHVVQQGGGQVSAVQRQPAPPSKTPEKKIDKVYYQFIPTSTLDFSDLGKLTFRLSPDASFQPGPKLPQMLGVILKKLVQDQYTDDLLEPLAKVLVSDPGITRYGHFNDPKPAIQGEKMKDLFIEIGAFLTIEDFIAGKGLTLKLNDEEKKKLQRSIDNRNLWADMLVTFKEQGIKPPVWYDRDTFDVQMLQYLPFLEDYGKALNAWQKTHGQSDREKGIAVSNKVFDLIWSEAVLLEAIRTDGSLRVNPDTQLAYYFIWQIDKDQAQGKAPVALRSPDGTLAFLRIAHKHENMVLDARTRTPGRVRLLAAFANEYNIPKDAVQQLPPFPSFIRATDLNPDHSTVDTAHNRFVMVTDFSEVHGANLLNGVLLAMDTSMKLFHSWKVFKMPESLKKVQDDGASPSDMENLTNEFVKNSPQNLGDPVDSYQPDKDPDRRINMEPLGLGDFVLMGKAVPSYKKDWVQPPGTAGFPFFVTKAEELARTSAFDNPDQIDRLKKEAAAAKDPATKAALEKEIVRLQNRETTDLMVLTKADLEDTRTLLANARRLRDFIIQDRKQGLSYSGNKTTDPFMVRMKKFDHVLFELFAMIRQTYPENKYGDLHAVEEYITSLTNQEQDIKKLRKRTIAAGDAFKSGSPVYRVVAGLVKEKDGNLVPLIMLAGYHPDAEPEKGKYKMKLVDVTFDSPKSQDMIYPGDTVEAGDKTSGERDGIASAFHNFAGNHHYGHGRIVYRVPGTDIQGNLDSYTKWTDYLKMAVAALGLVLLVAGVAASGGLLSPAAAAVVSALGVAVGVAGAYLSIRNIQERREKGTFEWDTETSMDILNIIAGVFAAAGTAIKLTQVISRSANLMMTIEKARGLVIIYDAVNIGANTWLIHEKVKEDANAIREMRLPKAEEDELLSQVNLEAIQQGAMMAVSAYSMGRGVFEHFKAKAAGVSWHSWEQRGWIRKVNGKTIITDEAPPFIRAKMKLVGTVKDTDPAPPGSGKKPPGTGGDINPDVKPLPKDFEGSLPSAWQQPGKRPPLLDHCLQKMRQANMPDSTILQVMHNIAERYPNPNAVLGDFNLFLSQDQTALGKPRFDSLMEGLATPASYKGADLLMRRRANNQEINAIMDALSFADIGNLREKYPSGTDKDFREALELIVTRTKGSRNDVFDLLNQADPGEQGLPKLKKALEQLGVGQFTPAQVREQLKFETELKDAFSKGGETLARKIFGNKIRKVVKNGEKVKIFIAESLKGQKAGDQARAFVNDRIDDILGNILTADGTAIDPMKWRMVREVFENSDLVTIQKNNIIGEAWAAAKVKVYGKEFNVIREVRIYILDDHGRPTGDYAILDAVLLKGEEVVAYKEFKSSDTAEVREGTQDIVFDRLRKGELNKLRPGGKRARTAFGEKMPNFKAMAVDIERPSGL